MLINKKLPIILVPLLLLINSTPLYPISNYMRASYDYRSTLSHLRYLLPTIENFASVDQKKKYEDVKLIFRDATENFYAQNYDLSFKKYFKVKEDLSSLMEEISSAYLDRSKEILDSTSKTTFDIIIKYSKDTTLGRYFRKPYNPVEEKKPYEEDEYHFFHDREQIEKYLNEGYRKLNEANTIFNDPDLEYIKTKKKKTAENLDFIIKSYSEVISNCRQAKKFGIYIHQTIKVNQINDIFVKYKISGRDLCPIFDDRIPEKYKIDAIDNDRLIYSIEKERVDNRKQSK